MLKPYQTISRVIALFKAAGLAVPAYGEEEKRRLLDAWVQRYGALDGELCLACGRRLASGQRFPRFYDMDAVLKEADRMRRREKELIKQPELQVPIDYERNKERLHLLIEHLSGRHKF